MIGQGFIQRNSNLGGLLTLVILGLVIVFLIVLFNEAQRRIPVQYGRRSFRGGRMYRQQGTSYLPLRVNSAGMIPLIFAFSIIILPGTIASYFTDPLSDGFLNSIASFILQGTNNLSLFAAPFHF